jgi:hypothetical protein
MSRTKLVLFTGAAALLIAACSSPKAATTPPASTAPAASNPATAAPAATTAPAATGLSGKWSGKYSGAYQGTFKLSWHQRGSKLRGTIGLSAPVDTLPINGTVKGDAIRFGTVGSVGIRYSGTVSGSTMSGTYQVGGPSGPSTGGPWSASKTS